MERLKSCLTFAVSERVLEALLLATKRGLEEAGSIALPFGRDANEAGSEAPAS